MKLHQPRYRFAAIADVHIDLENGGKSTYFIHAEENFRRALAVIKQRGCAFIVSAGDQVTNASGAVEEWQLYRRIIEESGYSGLVLEAVGNHETRSAKYGINTLSDCLGDFIRYTRLKEKPVLRPEGKTYYEYTEPVCEDVFLFLSCENGMNTNEIDNFSDEQMDWIEERLDAYRRKSRLFLIQHANSRGCGVGDRRTAPAYDGAIRTKSGDGRPFVNNRRFLDLLKKHPQLIWLSGHTHIDLRDGVNFASSPCHMLHIPALAGSTRIVKDQSGGYTLDRAFTGDNAQGYIADVYDDRVIFRGIDFLSDAFYPAYTYIIRR